LRAVIGIGTDTVTGDRIRRGLVGEHSRYGVLFLGDNNFLLDCAELRESPGDCYWFVPVRDSAAGPLPRTTRLTVDIDRSDLSRTVSHLYAPAETASPDPPEAAWTLVNGKRVAGP
jgi:CRISPR-associated protein Cas5t